MQLETQNKIKGPHIAEVLNNIQVSNDTYKLVFKNDAIAKAAKPGQFVSVLCEDLLIRRPFSVANSKDNTFEIIYKIKGKGTKYLSSLKTEEEANIIGPFGNGFNPENLNSLLIGCGVGIAPIIFLSNILKSNGIKHTSLACAQSYINLENDFAEKPIFITEDGSAGLKGRLDSHLEKIIDETKPKKIYTCGPNPAMAYISQVAEKYNITVETALERDFACGTGVCMGCVIQIKDNDKLVNKRICKDGPVFKGSEVIW